MKTAYNKITDFLNELLNEEDQRDINEALSLIYEEEIKIFKREVFIFDKIRKKHITFIWNNKKKYGISIKALKKAEQENKILILKDEVLK